MPRAPLLIAVATLLALATAAPDARADIWKYTDAEGVVHFTNSRPTGKRRGQWTRVMRSNPSSGKAAAKRGSCDRCDIVPARDKAADRYTRYDEYIREASELYQIPVSLIRAVIRVESDYDPRVVSSKGARGLMQLMPSVVGDMRISNVHDPRENILGGTRLLRLLANRFDGDLVLTIAAYHSGGGKVSRYMDVPPFPRVQQYVRMVLSHYYKYKNR